MEDLIEAIKSNDLVAVRKVFETAIAPVVASLMEERKKFIAASVMIEGEESEEDDDDDKDDDTEDKDDGDGDKDDKKDKDDE